MVPRSSRLGRPLYRSLSTWNQSIVRVRTSEKHGPKMVELDNSKPITWYACGPTVYDVSHLGHARNYVTTDILRRILTNHFHFEVKFALGMTDVDDKIIAKGKQVGCQSLEEFIRVATKYEMEYFADMDQLGVLRPHATLRVTEHIPEIITFIETLIAKNHAYVAEDGVYFRVKSLPHDYEYDRFGNAATGEGVVESDLEAPSRRKEDPRDFALWKRVPESEAVGWTSPFGYGRPGWHIECSAVTRSYFGDHMDVHSGGVDLKFPHHTNESAQSHCHQCQSGQAWVKLWIHTGHLHIEGRKMSKSLKNFISIQDYLHSGLSTAPAEDFRLVCLQHKYSSLLTYSSSHIKLAEQLRKRLTDLFATVAVLRSAVESAAPSDQTSTRRFSRKPTPEARHLESALLTARSSITQALADDFDTPLALQHVHSLLSETHKYLSLAKQSLLSTSPSLSPETPTGEKKLSPGVVMHPLEPLFQVEDYLVPLFAHSFGVSLFPAHPAASSSRSQDQLLSSHPSASSSPQERDMLVDVSVDFRARVRRIVMDHLRAEKVRGGGGGGSGSVGEVSMCKEILQECDRLRDRYAAECGVRVEDVGRGVAKWSRQ